MNVKSSPAPGAALRWHERPCFRAVQYADELCREIEPRLASAKARASRIDDLARAESRSGSVDEGRLARLEALAARAEKIESRLAFRAGLVRAALGKLQEAAEVADDRALELRRARERRAAGRSG